MEDLNGDEVLQTAFGMNVIRDFISNDKLLVEGTSDKILLQKILNYINSENCIKITNGKGDNLPAVASLSGYYEIYPLVLVDADEAGQKIKNDIIKIGTKYSVESVFTIRDLCGNIKENGTIEDTLPVDYVLLKANEILLTEDIPSIELNEELPFCEQVKLHLQRSITDSSLSKKEKKDKIENIILEIKKKISDDYDAKNSEEKAPLLYDIATKIYSKFT